MTERGATHLKACCIAAEAGRLDNRGSIWNQIRAPDQKVQVRVRDTLVATPLVLGRHWLGYGQLTADGGAAPGRGADAEGAASRR